MALNFTVYAKRLPVAITLSYSAIYIETQSEAEIIKWDDVLGACMLSCDLPSFALLTYCKSGKDRVFKVKARQRRVYVEESSKRWVNIIQNRLLNDSLKFSDETPRRRFIVLVNPFSGRKLAPGNWVSVQHFFEACDVKVVETQHPGHAAEIAAEATDGDIITVVSGDGLVHEVINALCKVNRSRAVAISVIPGGTSNALAYELCMEAKEPFSCESCAFIAITGARYSSDLMKIELLTEHRDVFAFMTFTWAIVADIDINSEL